MSLLEEIFDIVKYLSPACCNKKTFKNMFYAILAMCIGSDSLGTVTGFMRTLFLKPSRYLMLLNFFCGKGVKLRYLQLLWAKFVSSRFTAVRLMNKDIYIIDGIHAPKEGRKMPAVKSLYSASQNNSKPEYIMGHDCQVIAKLTQSKKDNTHATLIRSDITHGIVTSNRSKQTVFNYVLKMLEQTICPQYATYQDQPILLADAYYGCQKMMRGVQQKGMILITRAKANAVAFEPPPEKKQTNKGRPKLYGNKIKINHLFKNKKNFKKIKSPVYNEKNIDISICYYDLLIKSTGNIVRVVLANHPRRGRIVLMSTSTEISPEDILKAYGWRFKIEVSFKSAVHEVGAWSYRFWMKMFKKIKKGDGNQYLHHESKEYRQQAQGKVKSYSLYTQLACIALGVQQHLAIKHPPSLWQKCKLYFRTINRENPPSTRVVQLTLRHVYQEYLRVRPSASTFEKMIAKDLQEGHVVSSLLTG